jgi:hypothetical protein
MLAVHNDKLHQRDGKKTKWVTFRGKTASIDCSPLRFGKVTKAVRLHFGQYRLYGIFAAQRPARIQI